MAMSEEGEAGVGVDDLQCAFTLSCTTDQTYEWSVTLSYMAILGNDPLESAP
jgi:hypothetical protein